jgi:hypothetical protein
MAAMIVQCGISISRTQESAFDLQRLDRETAVVHHDCLEPPVVIAGDISVVSSLPVRVIPPAMLANDQLAVVQTQNKCPGIAFDDRTAL